jgi:hypothetical protein
MALPHELSHGYNVQVTHGGHHQQHYPAQYYEAPVAYDHHDKGDYYAYPKYKFEYGVKDVHTGSF